MEKTIEQIVARKQAKILVVDDIENARNLLKRRLSIYGYEVIPVKDSEQALKILKNHPIDVIFLDMFLYGKSSYNFLKTLKKNDKYKNIPVIMISSDSDMEFIVRCIEAGAEDYMIKPLNQTLLRARLSNCIARKEAYDKEIQYLAKIEQGQKQIAEQEKMASIGSLVKAISQELKNPLNFIINFAEVSAEICSELYINVNKEKAKMASDTFEYLNVHLKKFQSNVKKISEYGQNADNILRFMLSQSKEESSPKYPGDINKIVIQTVNILLSTYKSNGKSNLPRIETALDNAVPRIMLSIQSLSKAIYNILDNAVYAVMKKYEDNISAAKIKITTENTPTEIIIVIYDNGDGIKENIRNEIFTPFFTTKSEENGIGLGLSNAKKIIEDHNGSISVKSVEGKFTEFTTAINK